MVRANAKRKEDKNDRDKPQVLQITGSAGSYDINIKYLLADKQVLARILKYAVSEFKDMSIDDIRGCISNDIEIGIRSIDAGLTNLERISGANTEDSIPGEGKSFLTYVSVHILRIQR